MVSKENNLNIPPSKKSSQHNYTIFGINLTEILRDRGGNTVIIVLGMAFLAFLGYSVINSKNQMVALDGNFILIAGIILVILFIIAVVLFRSKNGDE
jgi:hypothetical protein